MAGKSALPLIIGVGAAALLLGGKKKKTTNGNGKKPADPDPGKPFLDVADWEASSGGGAASKREFDAECKGIANKVDLTPGGAYDSWITGRYFQLLAEGNSLEQITMQLMVDQGEHCPWGDPSKYTPLMRKAFDDTLDGVTQFHAATGGKIPDSMG